MAKKWGKLRHLKAGKTGKLNPLKRIKRGKTNKIAHLLALLHRLKGKPITLTDGKGRKVRVVFRGFKGLKGNNEAGTSGVIPFPPVKKPFPFFPPFI
ncbi:hypothetical protein [Ammoniphilus sp. YIM 78166]|uniref:hypothetical protein n=1 Tax=Ammoniphilus sp. YIM 78166 TaxID=1644106 RepID=UPI00106F74E8|nr:hypothetical protein [Ammoniphilus sp. YIM 78166]